MTTKWLDRSMTTLPFYWAVFTRDADFRREVKGLDLDGIEWPHRDCAKVVSLQKGGKRVRFILLARHSNIVSLVDSCAHEATHLWQDAKAWMSPNHETGDEWEAYTVGNIAGLIFMEARRQWAKK